MQGMTKDSAARASLPASSQVTPRSLCKCGSCGWSCRLAPEGVPIPHIPAFAEQYRQRLERIDSIGIPGKLAAVLGFGQSVASQTIMFDDTLRRHRREMTFDLA